MRKQGWCVLAICLAAFLITSSLVAQTPTVSLRGQVLDPSGAVIPGATVILRGPSGKPVSVKADAVGQYVFDGLKPGSYTLLAGAKGFAAYRVDNLDLSASKTLDIHLEVAVEAQEVTVSDITNQVSVSPDSNAGALVLRGSDLDMLSDDPDQLAEDLQALAGPAAGPNGGQIFVDGFSGGQLPPKSSIREIRINQNPFSAEYDRLGFGRIEIFTKPGTDKFRGQFFSMFSDNALNARNPFVAEKPPFQSRFFGGTLSGPVTKKSSFSFDMERRGIDENAVINATILDQNLAPTPYQKAVITPETRMTISPRFDYAINDKNTLVVRYMHSRTDNRNQGIGGFSLDSRAYDMRDRDHSIQITETNILSTRTINETRFQFLRNNTVQTGDNTIPTIQVLDAFTGGGAQIGRTSNEQNRWELHNLTTHTRGTHAIKFGGRIRGSSLSDFSPQNYGGTYTFAGGPAPLLDANLKPVIGPDGAPVLIEISSLERFRRTELLRSLSYSGAQIRALGGGPSQYTVAAGNPLAKVDQVDLGVFALDDWRVRPNFTFSYGLRYETQTNISDYKDFAPRISFAWGVGKGNTKKTVIRGGFGTFFDRVADSLTLQTIRFNGVNQQQYVVANPDFYPLAPPVTELNARQAPQAIRKIDTALQAPRVYQTAIGVERQLPRNTTLAVNYVFSRGTHMLRTRNVNAPLADGSYPLGSPGVLYLYESSGSMRHNQLITNFNSRISPRMSLFGFYALGSAKGDTDGAGTLPANSYDLRSEWGPTAMDVRHRVFIGGSITTPGGLSLSPFFTASSGAPFNIITGLDNNHDSVFNDRPAFATDPNAPGVVSTRWGLFKLNPGPGDTIIPRNYARGPAHYSLNLRLSRTWGFGSRGESGPGADWRPMGGPGGGPGGGRHGGGPPMMMGGGRGPGGPGGIFGSGSTSKRFNLTLSMSVRNLLNTVNLSTPVGNLSSPLFGESLSLAGGFGPMGSSPAANRRIDLQLRLSF